MALTDYDIQRQIRHMIAFIDQEASEKAEEIDSKAEEEYNIEKARLMEDQRTKISETFQNKKNQNELQRKIHNSHVQNAARLRVLKAKEEHMKTLVEQAHQTLERLAADEGRYKQILVGLITQGMFQLMEDTVVVRCRNSDLGLVQSVLSECINNYKQLCERNINIAVDPENFINPKIAGGVELLAQKGKIRVENTLDSRLEMLGVQMVPELRDILFGINANRKFRD